MNQKIVIVFSVFILSSLVGGFFLFKNQDILKQNPFLASIVKFKGAIVLSETDLIALKEKINFLESELSEKKIELEKIDDLSEENDLLNQRIIELYWEIESLELAVLEAEQNKIQQELEEEAFQEVEDEKEQIEEEIDEEIILCERTSGASSLKNKVIINEVAWMGDLNSANNEWIELKNISNEEINLNGWQLQDKNQQISIVFDEKDVILSNQLYLLKRAGDSIILNVEPDKNYTGTLSNQNESLYLFDENCQLQDEVSADSNWPAGDNSSKRTMERKYNFNWQSSLNPQGTPKAENSSGYVEPVVVVIPASGGGGSGSSAPQPQILLSFPLENPVNKEIEVDLSVLNLKNSVYDIKISILKISDESEQARTLTKICNEDETNCEESSYKYLTEAIPGEPVFPLKFKLKIVKDIVGDFPYEADIIVKIRQNDNQKVVSEFKGKINITEAELESIKEYNLTINIIGEGTTNPEAGTYLYQDLEEVNIIASPAENWEFAGWTGDEEVKETEINIIMNQDKIVTANFQEKEIIEPDPEPEPQNLLSNEFFDEWEDDMPKNWNKSNRAFQSNFGDGIKGNYALAFDHNFAGPYNDDQEINFESEGDAEKIYYGEIQIKGKTPNEADGLRIGILRPGYTTYDYSDWKKIDSEEWISINHEIIGNKDGNILGLRIQQKGISGENTNLLIGAAWLGITEPPDDWPN